MSIKLVFDINWIGLSAKMGWVPFDMCWVKMSVNWVVCGFDVC